jgi:ribosomal protein S18 acetylase RimI-like enzyme
MFAAGPMQIRQVNWTEIPQFMEHSSRQSAQAMQSNPPSTPRLPGQDFDPDKRAKSLEAMWLRDLASPSWGRAWAAWQDGRIVGNVRLQGSPVPAERHRALLMIGVEREYHRRGTGSALMAEAIAFAQEHALAWIDLGVFSGNEPARALYQKLGFVEIGRKEDQFRVGDTRLVGISMALDLRK